MMADAPNKQNSSIELCTGAYLDLRHPDPAMITPEVLAHHLSQVNRYAGAPKRPISVAEHTILVSKKLEADGRSPLAIMRGLHHDDAEAFLHDITRPLKDQLDAYRIIEDEMTSVINLAIGLDAAEDSAVKGADEWALSCEAWHLMPSQGRGWWCEGLYDSRDATHVRVALWLKEAPLHGPAFMARMWLLRHYKYLAMIR